MMLSKPKLLVLVGPTAIGKTRLSIEIAKRYHCEIISGDSMQVYRGMDIGTAKISDSERQGIPHHLINIVEPDEPFSAASFQERSAQLIIEINHRNRLPFIVGGTGLYIESLCYDFQFGLSASDTDYREHLTLELRQYGEEALHQKLQAVDPESALRLHPNDTRRIIRALEIWHMTGNTLSSRLAEQSKQSPYDLCIVGLTMDRAMLYKRIEHRIDLMMQQGLLDEVHHLMNRGYNRELISMQGLGYKELIPVILGECELKEAITILKRNTRHFAKRQLSWFRHMKEIHWIDVSNMTDMTTLLDKMIAIIS